MIHGRNSRSLGEHAVLWGMEKALWVGDVSVIHAKSTVRTVLIIFFNYHIRY